MFAISRIRLSQLPWLFFYVFACMLAMTAADLATTLKTISMEAEGGEGAYRTVYYLGVFSIWGAVFYYAVIKGKLKRIGAPWIMVSICFGVWIVLNLLLLVGFYPLGIRKVMTWLGGLLFFYLYVDGDLSRLRWIAVCMLCTIIPLGVVANIFSLRTAIMKGSEFVVINQIYNVLPLLPWCLVIRQRIIQIAIVAVVALLVGISAKRGAFIGFTVMTFGMFLCDAMVRGNFSKVLLRLLQLCIVGVVGGAVLYLVDQSRGGAIYYRLQDAVVDKGSGRLDIYDALLTDLQSFSLFEWIFGSGYYASAMATGKSGAHNDWIEVLYDFGLLGLGMFALMNLFIFMYWFKLLRMRHFLAAPLIGFYLLFFCLTLYSIILSEGHFIWLTAGWGAIYSFRNQLMNNHGIHGGYSPRRLG